MGRLHLLDWVVLAVYGAAVVAIGIHANRRQKTTEDYLLGGRRMRWWAVGISLIATSFSSAALIGGTGFGFAKGMGYLQLQLGDLLAIALACALFLPFFSRLRLTTAYEYLERRFGVATRTVASALFIFQTLLRTGILVLGPALALSAVLGVDLRWAIAVSGLAAVLYSATGGLAAVVWTDMIQLSIVVFGVAFCLVLVAGDVPGGLGAVMDHAAAADRLRAVDFEFTWKHPFNVLGALIAYGALALSIAGTNQQAVQRYLSCEDVGAARRAAFLGWGIGFGAVALTLFLGVALSAWSELAVGGAVLEDAGDQVLPRFILARLPMGVAGLLVAAIFAASMSSMDSAIHSMSTATLVDFVRRFRRAPLAAARELRLARYLTIGFGILSTGAALVAAGTGTQLLETLITWLGYVAGPLLGLFVLGLASRRANEPGALIGVACGAALVIGAVVADLPARYAFHALWLAPASCALTVAAGWVASLARPAPEEGRVRDLTWRSG